MCWATRQNRLSVESQARAGVYSIQMIEFKVNIPDSKLLEDLVDSEKLSDEEEAALTQMLDDLTTGRFQKLTPRQRDWAEGVHKRLGLDPGTENLVSSGRVKVTEEQRTELQGFLGTLGPKRLRPPGR
jgi:hypothetical protein